MPATKSFNRAQVAETIDNLDTTLAAEFNTALETETQTDKEVVKLVPCISCKRPLVVTTFFAPAKARCSTCRGEAVGTVATVGQPIPGQTDPAKAVDLAACLVNKTFANALCPVHPDDEEHVMELKTVFHNDNYGPSELIGYSSGRPQYRQTATGETVMHQCAKCKAIVTYTTTAQHQFRRVNEPKLDTGKHANGWASSLGVREDQQAA